MAEQVEMKAKVVQSEVKAVTARHRKALEERECELLWKVRMSLFTALACHYDGSAHVDSGCGSVAAIYAGIRGPFKEGPGPEGAWSFLCPALGRRQTGVCWTLSWA